MMPILSCLTLHENADRKCCPLRKGPRSSLSRPTVTLKRERKRKRTRLSGRTRALAKIFEKGRYICALSCRGRASRGAQSGQEKRGKQGAGKGAEPQTFASQGTRALKLASLTTSPSDEIFFLFHVSLSLSRVRHGGSMNE